MFHTVLAKEFSNVSYGKIHRLTVDTYCLQPPDEYMVSSKSFAAHLTGMGIAMEYDNNSNLFEILRQWLDGNKKLEKPNLLDNVGQLTIAHVVTAANGPEHIKLVKEWAADVWDAYAIYHSLATDWIELAKRQFKSHSQ